MSTYHLSQRGELDGWAVIVHGASVPLVNTLCTTRREARAALKAMRKRGLFRGLRVEVLPVLVEVQPVAARGRRGRSNRARPLPLSRDIG